MKDTTNEIPSPQAASCAQDIDVEYNTKPIDIGTSAIRNEKPLSYEQIIRERRGAECTGRPVHGPGI